MDQRTEPVFPFPRSTPLTPPSAYSVLREAPPRVVPLFNGQRAWMLTTYENVKALLAEPRTSSEHSHPNYPQLIPVPPVKGSMSFLRMDAPDHTRLRGLVVPELSPGRMERLRPLIQSTVDDLIDAMVARGAPADLVADLAVPMPSLVICELLGVPRADRAFFHEQSRYVVAAASDPEQGGVGMAALAGYMEELVDRKRAEPTDDLLGRLAARIDQPDGATREEVVAIGRLLLISGHETVTNMVGLGVLTLLQFPERLAELRADPTLIGPAIEELVRFHSIIQGGARVATDDIDINGTRIARDEGIIFAMLAANHDESVFGSPGDLDFHRTSRQHLAFGHGIHQCVGQALARVELDVTLTTLLARLPGLRLTSEEVPFQEVTLIHGLSELSITW